MLALALALASLATDVSWTDHSGQCPAPRGQAALEAAAENFDNASIDVEVEATDDGLTATLRLETPNGTQTRMLGSPACDTLVEAAVLITRAAAMAAIVPDPPAEPEPSEPESVPEPTPEPAPESVPVPDVVASSATGPSPIEPRTSPAAGSLFASTRAFGFGTFGTTPGFGGGGGFAVGLGATFWRAEVSGAVSAPTTTPRQPGVQAWAWAIGTRGCGTFDMLRGRGLVDMKTLQHASVPLLALSLLCACPAIIEEVGQRPDDTESGGGTGDQSTSADSEDRDGTGGVEGSSGTSGEEGGQQTGTGSVDCMYGGYGCCNDRDADDVPFEMDLDPEVPNPQQLDTDQDGIADKVDLCPFVVDDSGSNTADSDKDGIGNGCDLCGRPLSEYRIEEAAIPGYMQVRQFPLAGDLDQDGIGDACDNCPTVANCFDYGPEAPFTGEVPMIDGVACQADTDADGIGDACDPDMGGDASSGFGDQDDFDGDGLINSQDACPRAPLDDAFRSTCVGPQDCPDGHACSPDGQCNHRDTDADGVGDICDTCSWVPNPSQTMEGGAQDDDPDGDGVGDLCETGADMGCGDRANAARVAYHPVAVGGACCTVELVATDDGGVARSEGCAPTTGDQAGCIPLLAPHPESPGDFIPVRHAAADCSAAQQEAFECVLLPATMVIKPGVFTLPPGCPLALDIANLSPPENLEQGSDAGDSPWLRACRRPQLDSDFDGIGDACDTCASAWDPSNGPYIDDNGMLWSDQGAVCNGDYGECI